ncbi:ABC transporter permease subunit [Salinadaptatus halalkaliphilus]|uniref:ABC transporter permease subunit n=1 Tax=Salinadaptatus halalkaliphilus TaxID=2419781 RepID=A0A4S3TK00_9EURY|nr:ABC transporter permease subunit [Salinadaptatus halalkaliphilus]THE64414.1 ABC transporter permease subunit [Salinadaptatus halalkaliphilus]
MTDREPTARRGRLRVEGFESSTERSLEDDTAWPRSVERDREQSRTEGSVGRSRSRWRDIWRRFRSDRTALLGAAIVAILTVLAVFAWPLEVTTLGYRITLQPFALAPYDPGELYVGPTNAGPSLAHPFGTDWAGRDQFSRVLAGGRYSLSIGALAVALALCVGVPLGAIAGYVGGWVDEAIMRVVDILFAFPFLVLAIAIVAVLGQGYWNVVAALVITGWLSYARLIRGEILSVREAEYVTAAKALGASDRRIVARHVVPNAVAPVIVQATLNVGTVVLAAAALGFLGLGLSPDSAEWGTMLADGRSSLLQGHWHITVFPGLALFAFVLAINLVGDGLNDALEPRLEDGESRTAHRGSRTHDVERRDR